MHQLSENQRNFARELRSAPTEAERRLWSRLRSQQLGFKFRRQFPLGRYVADFVCLERRLIVELDGGQHVDSAHDALRDAWMKEKGFNVLRFWNNDVLAKTDSVVEAIVQALALPPPQPSPARGEGPIPPSPLTGEGRDGGAA